MIGLDLRLDISFRRMRSVFLLPPRPMANYSFGTYSRLQGFRVLERSGAPAMNPKPHRLEDFA